jgi:hypothetical protein
MKKDPSENMGLVAFLGSGETAPSGGRLFETLAKQLPQPLRIAILETPAGFELNSDQVAGRVGDFMRTRLQNYAPLVDVVPARKRGTPFSPDDPQILTPLLHADLVYMGAGSPSYAVRQLQDSLAWQVFQARHRLGATAVFASAAVVAVGTSSLPVYEIYKVGEDVHVKPGLNFFGQYDLHLSFVPHWNNAEGGPDLDTSHCFVGRDRFEAWRAMLPADETIIGVDEHTALIFNFSKCQCQVSGVGGVTVLRGDDENFYPVGSNFDFDNLGECGFPEPLEAGIPTQVWEMVRGATPPEAQEQIPSAEVLSLVEQRQKAREQRDWEASDQLRDQIAELGWQVQDTPEGPKVVKS